MKSIMLFGKKDIRFINTEIPSINDREVLIKVKAASLCGSDVRMYNNGYNNVNESNPLIMGHEVAGIIEDVGIKVSGYKKGMRVAVAPNMGCGTCKQCTSGHTHLCYDYQAFGINIPGAFAEYLVIPEKAVQQGNISILDDNISYEEAALIEPLSCVFNGQEIINIRLGDVVLIVGSGPIGIMHAMLANISGAAKVIMTDLQEARLDTAKEILPWLIKAPTTNLPEIINKESDGLGIDVAIIAAPSPKAQEESFNYMAMNGRVCFFGGIPKGKEIVPLNTNIIHYKQLQIVGSTRASIDQYRTCLKLVENGRIPLNKLISQKYAIEDFTVALDAAANAQGLKHVVMFD